MDCEWLEPLQQAYARTYKSSAASSRKNLRCFPACGPLSRTHSPTGFCGGPAVVLLSLREPVPADAEIVAIAEFVQVGADCQWRSGAEISEQELAGKVRGPEGPLRPWIQGRVERQSDGRFKVVFNEELSGWHYGWLSTKNTCRAWHCMRVVILERAASNPSTLRFRGKAESTHFQCFTRHRKGKAAAKSKPRKFASSESTASSTPGQDSGTPNSSAVESGFFEALELPAPPQEPKVAAGVEASKRRRDFDEGQTSPVEAMRKVEQQALPKPPLGTATPNTRTLDRLLLFSMRFGHGSPPTSEPQPRRSGGSGGLGATQEQQRQAQDVAGTAIFQGDKELDEAMDFLLSGAASTEDFGNLLSSPPPPPPPPLPVDQTDSAGAASSAGGRKQHPNIKDEQTNAFEADPWSNLTFDTPAASLERSNSIFSLNLELDPPDTPPRGSFTRWATRQLHGLLVEHNMSQGMGAEAETQASLHMDAVAAVSKHLAEVLMIPETSAPLVDMIKSYSTMEGLLRFKEMVARERDMEFEWHEQHEDEAYDPENPKLAERSIFAEVRQHLRDIMDGARRRCGQPINLMHLPMELAARHKLLHLDPFYPPGPDAAKQCAKDIYGVEGTVDYNAGADEFASKHVRQRFSKDLLILRRLWYRKRVMTRILEERSMVADLADAPGEAPVDPAYDVSGDWVMREMHPAPEALKNVTALLSTVTGVELGSLFGDLTDSQFRQITLRVNSSRFRMYASATLLGRPKLVLSFGGDSCKVFAPFPLPPDAFALQEFPRRACAYLCSPLPGRYGVTVVIDGLPSQKSTADFVRDFRSHLPEKLRDVIADAPAFRRFRENFAGLNLTEEDETDSPVLRVHISFYRVENDRIETSKHFLLFPRSRNAPRLGHPNLLRLSLTHPEKLDAMEAPVAVHERRCAANASSNSPSTLAPTQNPT